MPIMESGEISLTRGKPESMQSLAAKAVFPVPDAPYDNHIHNLALV